MALIIYPEDGYDSFISEPDAELIIQDNSLQYQQWLDLPNLVRDIYLRIATTAILNAVSTDSENPNGYLDKASYDASSSCLPRVCALVAMHDLVYQISSEINPNTGLITKEKVGDIEVAYTHGASASSRQLSSKNKDVFPKYVKSCLSSYGVTVSASGFHQVQLERS